MANDNYYVVTMMIVAVVMMVVVVRLSACRSNCTQTQTTHYG